MSIEEFPKEVLDAMERDAGITINKNKSKHKDERFCYGAVCTWFGSIHEIGTVKSTDPNSSAKGHGLPCCPSCGGMLFEMENESDWWSGVDEFEKGLPRFRHSHPGYRSMLEWQRKNQLCFTSSKSSDGVAELARAYQEATGTIVDVRP